MSHAAMREGPLSCLVLVHPSSAAMCLSQEFLMKTALQLLPTSMFLERFRLKSMDWTMGPQLEADPVMFFILYSGSREVETN